MSEIKDPDEEEVSGKRLTPAEWAEICRLAELGERKVSELARIYGISPAAISRYFKRHGIVIGSKRGEVAKAVEASVKEESAKFAAQRIQRLEETRNKFYIQNNALSTEIMKLIVDAKKKGEPVSAYQDDIKTLQQAIQALSILRKEQFDILDANSVVEESELPRIMIMDMNQTMIQELRSKSADDDIDLADLEIESAEDGDDPSIVVEEGEAD